MRQLEPPPPALRLRRMLVVDLDAVMRLNRAAFPTPWSVELFERELGHEWSTILLAEEPLFGSELLGFLVYWSVHDELHILNVATSPVHRRRGVAESLLCEALRRGREGNAELATLEVRRSNTPAIALYRKLGFEVAGVRPHYYSDGNEDALVMNLGLRLPPAR
jgi:[ribosomal protein S18]-alanine N-acetyltransferase